MPEKDLDALLKNMQPELSAEPYVFCPLSEAQLKTLTALPLCTFREAEAITVITPRQAADIDNLAYAGLWALITCTINSDLNAVGFLAAMSTALAKAGISVNAVSAYYHDHLFVPWDRRHEALETLTSFQKY